MIVSELQAKLDSYTDKSGDCWIWTLSLNSKGYGRVRVGDRVVQTHRLSWELANGSQIPEGMIIRHTCDTRDCLRPSHLLLGTHKDNRRDRMLRGPGAPYQRKGEPRVHRIGPISEKFPLYVQNYGEEGSCWIWNAQTNRDGYGVVFLQGFMKFSHRVSYELHKGEIPEGLLVRHSCDVRACVNPDHLLLGTHADNVRDRVLRDRTYRALGESHPSAKLTESDVREIRVKHASGETQTALGHEYGVSSRQIGYIVHRKKWKHVV